MKKYLRAANVVDGSLDLSSVLEMNFSPREQDMYALEYGDVLVTEGSGSLGAVGASAVYRSEFDETVCFQNTLLRLRPRSNVDGRFLGWWARSAHGSGLFASIASGANIYHLSSERLRSLSIALPSLDEQRTIADFLDIETRRIDRLRLAKQRQVEVLAEHLDAALDALLFTNVPGVPLARLVDAKRPIQYGIVLPGPNFPDGVPVIKGGDVSAGRVSPDRLSRTDPSIDAVYARSRVKEDDLVMAIRGGVGEIIRVPASLSGANLTQDSARIASDKVNVDWLEAALQAPGIQQKIASRITGATIKGINIESLRRIPIPTPSYAVQAEIGQEAKALIEQRNSVLDRIEQTRKLLAERRQAIIMAAVTGQLDVSTACSDGAFVSRP